jgi:leucyl-tRNA synthetase
MADYDFQEIEARWQKRWAETGAFEVSEDPSRPKYYCLEMLPYPSGNIHVGHVRNYCITDVISRSKTMRGFNVMHPIGWDALGLPAENAAIQRGIHPEKWTRDNIAGMKRQLQRMGFSYDWSREIATCDAEYYRWNQWFFLRMLEKGIAYRANSPVNWCPSCQTVLANEQAEGGICWRCKSDVEQRDMEQWFLRITAYQDQLLDDMAQLPTWPDRVLVQQRNWIGRSPGAEVDFGVEGGGDPIRIFTTRVDTIYGATFMVLAPEHPMVDGLLARAEDAAEKKEQISRLRAQDRRARLEGKVEKEGVFTGRHAINPYSGERIPIWVGNFVLMGYGTGAIMSVPAHDQRDLEFARKYHINVRVVIQPEGPPLDGATLEEAYVGPGKVVNSGPFGGLTADEAIPKMAAYAEEKGFGKATVTYRLRDWLISRQRYWGAPIPMIYCSECGVVPVPYEELPVLLPADAEIPSTGENALKFHEGFLNVTCPMCGGPAQRETDTMDTFMCSSWYHYAYVSPYWKAGEKLHRDDKPWSPEAGRYWLPVDQYTGGPEHATMHLLYTRFFTKALRDMGVVPFGEPMLRLYNQGIILGPDGNRMSKSKGNVVAPDEWVSRYGADVVRAYLMFIGPWDMGGPWSPQGIEGVSRFLDRVWNVVTEAPPARRAAEDEERLAALERDLRHDTHRTIKKVTEDIEAYKFNTVIAGLMEFNNALVKAKATAVYGTPAWEEAVDMLLLMLAPEMPHIAEELWQQRHGRANYRAEDSIHVQPWPAWDPELARADTITLVVQVNGKVRDKIDAPAGISEEEARRQAMSSPAVQRWLEGKTVRKVIFAGGKLVNIVVG